MKALKFIAIAIMLLAATAVSAQVKFDTRPYQTSTFSATFPVADGDPVTASDDPTIKVPIATTNREGAVYLYSLLLKNDAVYEVFFQEFPKGFSLTNDTPTLDHLIDGDGNTGEKFAHIVSEEKSDAQVGSVPARQVITHTRGTGNPIQGDYYAWQRLAVVPTGIWTVMVACPEKAGCTTADAMTFLNSVVIKNVQSLSGTQPTQPLSAQTGPAQSAQAPQPAQAPADPRKKIFLEFTRNMHASNIAAMLIPGVDPSNDDTNSERVVRLATKLFIQRCPAVLVTTDQAAADFTLILHAGNSILYKDKSAVFVSPAQWPVNAVKDVCTYVNGLN